MLDTQCCLDISNMLSLSCVLLFGLVNSLFSYSPVSAETVNNRYDVVIIGAGVAGIAAGQKLLENNITNIRVLEARDRLGGRIHTVKFGGETIDLGAQYVYAFDGNTVYDLAKDLDLFYNSPHRKSELVSWEGYKLKKPHLNEMMKLPMDMNHHDSASYSKIWLPKLSEYIIRNNISYEDGTLYLDAGRKLFSIHNGADVDEVSAWGITHYRESSYGRSKMFDLGFHNFIKLLMGELRNRVPNLGLSKKIHKKKEVTGVSWDDSGAIVYCADGTSYLADKVIVTLPLGVLKHLPKNFFLPPLTEERTNVIKNLGFGFVDKLFLQFDQDVTMDRNVLFALNSAMKQQFTLTYFKDMWPTRMTGICPTRDSSHLLHSWLVGQDAVTMEQLSKERVRDGMVAIMEALLAKNIPKPLGVLRSKWATDRFSKGSYSFRSVQTEIYNVSHGQLAQPLLNSYGQPVVLFAGEATSERHYGTIHGALETGWDAAQAILYSIRQSIKLTTN